MPDYAELDEHTAVWVADARFLLDQLGAWSQMDPEGLLTGRLDLDRVGVFGHSYGGAMAVEACFQDPRLKACENLDGGLFSPARSTGGRAIVQPLMLQLAANHPKNDYTITNAFNGARNAWEITIDQTEHGSFFDGDLLADYFLGPAARQMSFGALDPRRATAISNAYTIAFFRRHLIGDAEPLLDGNSPFYPEVSLIARP
jgi:hypothetical protein